MDKNRKGKTVIDSDALRKLKTEELSAYNIAVHKALVETGAGRRKDMEQFGISKVSYYICLSG